MDRIAGSAMEMLSSNQDIALMVLCVFQVVV
jgi:hypothetical protein